VKSDRPLPTILTLLAAAGFALVAFAANSVPCRLALGGGKIGAADSPSSGCCRGADAAAPQPFPPGEAPGERQLGLGVEPGGFHHSLFLRPSHPQHWYRRRPPASPD
jgi:hypothetical protein